jgi:glycosyltransferase involved in cell wall biosynthesis
MLRFEERRGAAFLLPALARIAHRPDVEIVFFGHQQVTREAARFPFRHAGVLSTEGVATLLSSAHIVVDPSLFQGFGLVGLEGMSCGAACVLTASGGVAEYAVDGENALLVPPKDSAALAAAILRLVTDVALRERIAAAGLKTARTFTWERAAERYRAFMDSLPPPDEPTPKERAVLDLLGRELTRGSDHAKLLRDELKNTREVLESIYGSRAWKIVQTWRRFKARLP